MTNEKRAGDAFLMLLWIMTAAAVLVVTIIYFDRLNKLAYGKTDESPSRAIDKVVAAGPGETAGDQDPGDDAEVIYRQPDEESEDETPVDPRSDVPEPEAVRAGDDELATTGPGVVDTDAWDVDLHDEIDPSKPIIALSFDDGPGRYTEQIVEVLKENGCEATFFLVGYSVERFPERVKLLYESGMEIGNHTSDHAQLTSGTDSEITARVYENEALINEVIPVGRILVRPPYGDYTEHTGELIDRPMVNWSVDSEDWKSKDKDAVLSEIKANAHDGYIILMHEIQECTAEAIPELLPWLKEQGYQVTTVSKMFAARGVTLERGKVYRFVHAAR